MSATVDAAAALEAGLLADDVGVCGAMTKPFVDVSDTTLKSVSGLATPISSVRCHERNTVTSAPCVQVPSLPPTQVQWCWVKGH